MLVPMLVPPRIKTVFKPGARVRVSCSVAQSPLQTHRQTASRTPDHGSSRLCHRGYRGGGQKWLDHAVLGDEYLARHLGSFLVGDDLLK